MNSSELTRKQMTFAAKTIRRQYQLNQQVTDEEVMSEISNLRRKERKGNLDDFQELLVASLSVGSTPIHFHKEKSDDRVQL